MYAVIATGGKQYRVSEGDVIRVEKLGVEAGESVVFDKVLMVADGEDIRIGAPYVEGGAVSGSVQANGRGKKVEIIKFRRRKHHRKQMGHRQSYTEVEITGISLDGSAKPAKSEKKPATKAASSKPASNESASDTKTLLADKEPVKPELLDAPNGEKDDLTKLTGLGPKFEEQANALGIFHYSQIANFSLENFRWLDDNTRGKIEPIKWVEEAKALMK